LRSYSKKQVGALNKSTQVTILLHSQIVFFSSFLPSRAFLFVLPAHFFPAQFSLKFIMPMAE
jgi:hypothetical protein